jgi:hypothetical protein
MLPMMEMSPEERKQLLLSSPEGYSGPVPRIIERVFDAFPAYMICLLQLPAGSGSLWVKNYRTRGLLAYEIPKQKTLPSVKERLKRRLLK